MGGKATRMHSVHIWNSQKTSWVNIRRNKEKHNKNNFLDEEPEAGQGYKLTDVPTAPQGLLIDSNKHLRESWSFRREDGWKRRGLRSREPQTLGTPLRLLCKVRREGNLVLILWSKLLHLLLLSLTGHECEACPGETFFLPLVLEGTLLCIPKGREGRLGKPGSSVTTYPVTRNSNQIYNICLYNLQQPMVPWPCVCNKYQTRRFNYSTGLLRNTEAEARDFDYVILYYGHTGDVTQARGDNKERFPPFFTFKLAPGYNCDLKEKGLMWGEKPIIASREKKSIASKIPCSSAQCLLCSSEVVGTTRHWEEKVEWSVLRLWSPEFCVHWTCSTIKHCCGKNCKGHCDPKPSKSKVLLVGSIPAMQVPLCLSLSW